MELFLPSADVRGEDAVTRCTRRAQEPGLLHLQLPPGAEEGLRESAGVQGCNEDAGGRWMAPLPAGTGGWSARAAAAGTP